VALDPGREGYDLAVFLRHLAAAATRTLAETFKDKSLKLFGTLNLRPNKAESDR